MKRFGFDLLFEVQVPRPWTEGKEREGARWLTVRALSVLRRVN